MNAKRLGRGPDGVDQSGVLFEIRESRRTSKYRLQKDVHEELCKRNGYYLFKRGKTITKVDANDITPLLKKGRFNRDRTYPYKFLDVQTLRTNFAPLQEKAARQFYE